MLSTIVILMTICFIIGNITRLRGCSILYIINAPTCGVSTPLFHISVITVECLWLLWIFDAQRRPTYYRPLFIIDWLDVCFCFPAKRVLFRFCPCVCLSLSVCLSVCSTTEKVPIRNFYVYGKPCKWYRFSDIWPWPLTLTGKIAGSGQVCTRKVTVDVNLCLRSMQRA